MSELKLPKKPRFTGWRWLILNIVFMIIGFILLFGDNLFEFKGMTSNFFGFVFIFMSIMFLFLILIFGRLFTFADKYTLPKPTRPFPEQPPTSGHSFTVYYHWGDKRKLRGYLDGNTAFYKNHKTIAGIIDDTNPENIELITGHTKRVFERIKNGNIYNVGDNTKVATLHNLKLTFERPERQGGYIKLKIDKSKKKGKIIDKWKDHKEEFHKEKSGSIEGDMEKMDDIKFYAILAFIFEVFC
jgi:hypothetical protein